MLHLLSILLSISCVLGSSIPQQAFNTPGQKSSVLSSDLLSKIEKLRTKWGVKGITIGLAASPNSSINSNGEWALEALSFGEADRYGNQVDSDTLFSIASNSKIFTALSIAMLIENGTTLPNGENLGWNTKIKDILPEWKLMDEYATDHADIMDLGTMRSGMPGHDFSHSVMEPAEVMANLRNLRPSSEIRQAWQYQNHHYLTLALVVERLTGLKLPDYVQVHILDPVGLSSTTYNATHALLSGHRSDGFTRTGVDITACREGIEQKDEKLDPKCLGKSGCLGWWTDTDALFEAGAGGIVTSGNDMARWIKELLEPTLIPPALIEKVTTTYVVMDAHPEHPEFGVTTYGLGSWEYTYRGIKIQGHSGTLPGQKSRMTRLPNLGFGFIIAINDDTFGSMPIHIITNMIVDEVLQAGHIDWELSVAKEYLTMPSYENPPENPRPVPTAIEGKYYDIGYGNLSLVKYDSSELTTDPESGLSGVELNKLIPFNVTGPIYITRMNKLFVTSLVFTHFDGPIFNWTAIYTRDNLDKNGSDVSQIAKVQQIGTAVFNNEGFGMFGNFWGKGSEALDSVMDEVNVKENAEVWFEKQ